MKKYLVILFALILLPFIGMSQNINCSKFKNGTFTIVGTDDYLIKRKDAIQVEENLKTGLITEFKVKWISECEYTLEPIRHIKNPEDQKFPDGELITITILKVKKNSYIQESTSNLVKEKREEEFLKVKK